jgi:CubicO group peptidase (beta-lactamase class C family)
MNKMFTGMAVMQLVQAGRLSPDATVGQYLPDYPNRSVADSVTIHQLLTHTSGMGNFWEEHAKLAKEKFKTVDDYLALFISKPLLFKPGSRYAYSNSGYILLGKIIEQVSGQTWFDYVKEHIFLPAKMNDTDALELDDALPRVATGYTMSREHPGRWKNNIYTNVIKGGPAGGSYSTTADLFRFADAVLTYKLLSTENTALYISGKVKYDRGSYAYGMSTDTLNGHVVFGHTGGHFGIANELMICPDAGYVVVILTNGEVENYWEISNFIKRELFGSTPAIDQYFFTRQVINTTIARGMEAGLQKVSKSNGQLAARESVIERWAFRQLFDKKDLHALDLFRLNRKLFPGSASALYNLGEGYRLCGDLEQAIAVFREYLSQEPDDEEVREKTGSLEKQLINR